MKDMLQKYELLNKATKQVEANVEKSVNQMTADFRRSGLEQNVSGKQGW